MSMGLISVKVAEDRNIVMLHRQDGSDLALIHQIWTWKGIAASQQRQLDFTICPPEKRTEL